jgi:hypothetical protein
MRLPILTLYHLTGALLTNRCQRLNASGLFLIPSGTTLKVGSAGGNGGSTRNIGQACWSMCLPTTALQDGQRLTVSLFGTIPSSGTVSIVTVCKSLTVS